MTDRAIILAAGRGSRMRRLTEEAPKCLTPLCGRPLLDWQLGALRAAGVRRITVVRGYRKETLSGDFETLDNDEWSTSNMVVTLTKADALLRSEPCVVSYSDIVYHADHVRALVAAPGEIRLTYDVDWLRLWTERNQRDPLADAETFEQEGGRLLRIGARPTSLDQVHGQYMGLLYFSPAGWERVTALLGRVSREVRNKLDMTSLLSRLLEDGCPIQAVPVQGRWCECDTEGDLELYESLLGQARPGGGTWHHDWR